MDDTAASTADPRNGWVLLDEWQVTLWVARGQAADVDALISRTHAALRGSVRRLEATRRAAGDPVLLTVSPTDPGLPVEDARPADH